MPIQVKATPQSGAPLPAPVPGGADLPDVLSDGAAPDFSRLPAARLEAMHDAAATVLRCEHVLAKSGMSVVSAVLDGQGDFTTWERYPKGDIHDPQTHSHYFYHAHAPQEMAEHENGHFHLFVHPAAADPDGFGGDVASRPPQPWALPGVLQAEDPAQRFAHIGAISVDARGRPLRLFTTNRWVTNETLYRADAVIGLLDRFSIELAHPNWAVSQWLNAMVVLYRPQLEALLLRRDQVLERAAHHASGATEDRALQNTSEVRIDHARQIGAIEQALS